LVEALHRDDEQEVQELSVLLKADDAKSKKIHEEVVNLMQKNDSNAHTKDSDYVFLTFVTQYLPVGLVGLLIAIIFLASMGSMASALNSLASTTIVDFYKRLRPKDEKTDERKDLKASRMATFIWGLFCVVVALFAGNMGNLIEVVNIMGSLFYGTILGIFLVAFYLKWVSGTAVFYAAIIAEVFICMAWWFELSAFLWLNVMGCLLVMVLAFLFERALWVQKTS